MNGTRSALIIASDSYSDPRLRQLRSPASDAQALMAVLQDPAIGNFEVQTLINEPTQAIREEVETFFADRQPDDLLLVHFSTHGVKGEEGELYFATSDTVLGRLGSTAVEASFVNRLMNRSGSRRVVLLLDCCYAGAFERGLVTRADVDMGIRERFDGRGRIVITASKAMEYAFEAGEPVATGKPSPSVFTSALVKGLETGDADRDQDGLIGINELYDYVYDEVRAATPNQTPGKWAFDVEGELYIAERSSPVTTPASLPRELQDLIDSPLPDARVMAVLQLETIMRGRHAGMRLAARLALEQFIDDDSRKVSAAATAALSPHMSPSDAQPELAQRTTSPVPVDEAAAVTQVEQVAVKPSAPEPSPSKDAPTTSRPPGVGRTKRQRSTIIAWVAAAICFITAVVAVIVAINAQSNIIYQPTTSDTYDNSTPSGTTLWSSPTQGVVESSPVVADSTVYVGSDDDQVYAMAATSGSVRWSDSTGDKVTSRPAVAGGTVYVGSNDHKVYAMDAATGHIRWTHTTGAAITSDLAVAGSTVYVGSNDHKLYALDATTGQVRWTHTTGDYVGSPAIAGNTVYVGSDDHKVYALNATTGDIRWTHTTGGAVTAGLAVAGSTVYVGSDQLYALDAATGRVRWTHATGTIESTPAVAGSIVYIGSLNDKVYAIDAATGRVRWTHPTGDVILSNPAVAGGTVYICSNDQSLHALNAATGHEIWTYPVGDNSGQNIVSSPAAVNGVVYVGSNNNEVYAFQARA